VCLDGCWVCVDELLCEFLAVFVQEVFYWLLLLFLHFLLYYCRMRSMSIIKSYHF